MRILTSICCSAIILPIAGLNVLANTVETSRSLISPEEGQKWTTNSEALAAEKISIDQKTVSHKEHY